MSKKTSRKNTFGWARAEVLGALVNAVFLVAVCFTIFVEAIERLTHVHHVEHVDTLIYVGVAGLVINVVGLLLFTGHSHSHDMELVVQDTTTVQQSQGKGIDRWTDTNGRHMMVRRTRTDGLSLNVMDIW